MSEIIADGNLHASKYFAKLRNGSWQWIIALKAGLGIPPPRGQHVSVETLQKLRRRELNPGLPRDRRKY